MNEHEHEHFTGHAQSHDNHLMVYLVWPLLAGLGLAVVLSLSLAGVVGLVARSLASAAIWGAFAFFIVWGLSTLVVFWYAARSWAGPLGLAKATQPVIERYIDNRPIEPPTPMIVRGYNTPPLIEAELASSIKTLEPDVKPEIKELYDVITRLWPGGDISQERVCSLFSRKVYDRHIGGSRRKGDAGTESGRGLLDRAGVIAKDGGGHWAIAASLADALSINDDLLEYAQARSQIVKISDKTDKTRQDRHAPVSGACLVRKGE